ncbi:MAG: glycerate kinase [Verrucomicrobiota bacterium]|nr:glycerate kinase [Verrucomicrobiota bacterium]
MRILIAPDKFKHSLGASEVAEAIAAGLRDVLPDAEITCRPVADGGEGTAHVICDAVGGEWHTCEVHDPLGRVVTARYCTIENGATAVMEMSEASGLWRLAPNEYDAMHASTFGAGEMLLEATKRGVREIIIGLGGSATNDGGRGMAEALGFRFANDRIVTPDEVRLPHIIAAVDVRNPLLGPRGATRTFAAQKGANAEQVEMLEEAMLGFAELVRRDLQVDACDLPGAGAAGGLGFGLVSFCGAELRSGFEIVAERIGLRRAVQKAEIVITGEGRLDAQTLDGKAPAGVAQLACDEGKRVFAIVGATSGEAKVEALFERVLVVGAFEGAATVIRQRARELAESLT